MKVIQANIYKKLAVIAFKTIRIWIIGSIRYSRSKKLYKIMGKYLH